VTHPHTPTTHATTHAAAPLSTLPHLQTQSATMARVAIALALVCLVAGEGWVRMPMRCTWRGPATCGAIGRTHIPDLLLIPLCCCCCRRRCPGAHEATHHHPPGYAIGWWRRWHVSECLAPNVFCMFCMG
jgi:hypothetical protein